MQDCVLFDEIVTASGRHFGHATLNSLATLNALSLDMAQEVLSRLRSASYKRLEILARGTHSMALELNRVDLYRRARDFLETRFI